MTMMNERIEDEWFLYAYLWVYELAVIIPIIMLRKINDQYYLWKVCYSVCRPPVLTSLHCFMCQCNAMVHGVIGTICVVYHRSVMECIPQSWFILQCV
jgi:hypothetical protein